jgi:hypothetical protein
LLCRHNNKYDYDDDDDKVSRLGEIKYYKTVTNTSNGTLIIHCLAMRLENSMQILQGIEPVHTRFTRFYNPFNQFTFPNSFNQLIFPNPFSHVTSLILLASSHSLIRLTSSHSLILLTSSHSVCWGL